MVTSAKVSGPQLPRVHLRQRVFDELDSLCDRRALWVHAPAGAGKTTAIASYLDARGHRFGWYSLDAGDAEAGTLFDYLTTLVRVGFAVDTAALPRFSLEYAPGIAVFSRRFFEAFFAVIPSGATVVFDDYHHLPQDSPTHEVMREAVSTVPSGQRVVFISRHNPPPAFSRSIANRHLATVGWDVLRFSEDETRELVALRSGRAAIDPSKIASLHLLTDGWAAGMILLLETPSTATREFLEPEGVSRLALFDYFASEVLTGIDPATTHVLLAGAWMPHVTPGAVVAITESPAAGQLLAGLCRQNLFTTRTRGDVEAYVLHPLFRDFLLRQAATRVPPAEFAAMRGRAALALARTGQLAEAMELFREQGAWQEALPFIRTHAPKLLATAQIVPLRAWFTWLPEAALCHDPWLRYWKAQTVVVSDPGLAVGIFKQAFDAFSAAEDAAGSSLAWAGAVQAVILEEADLRQLDPLLDLLVTFTSAHENSDLVEVEVKLAAAAILAHTYRERSAEIEHWFARARRTLNAATGAREKIEVGGALLFCLTYWGHLDEAEATFRSLRGLAADLRDPLSQLQLLSSGTFLLAHNRGSTVACREIVDEGYCLSRESGLDIYGGYLACYGAIAAVHTGDVAEIRRCIELSESAGALFGRARGFYNWARGLVAGETEGAAAAVPWFERALAWAEGSDYREGIALANAHLAWAAAEVGEIERAAGHLAAGNAVRSVSPRGRITLLHCESAYHLARADEQSALQSFAKAMRLSQQYGLVGCGWIASVTLAKLGGLALERNVESALTSTAVKYRKLVAPVEYAHSPRWPWPLRMSVLGGWRVWRSGVELEFSGKAPRMPLRLAKFLVAAGPTPVPALVAAEALWPQADGDLARRSLDTTVHRLRRLLGRDDAIVTGDGTVRLDAETLFVDFWSVEGICTKVTEALARGDSVERPEVERWLSHLIELYRGPLLPS
ncbi:MAG TPA: hypothetical protein VGF45_16455, partial [Polyangia bacterium]